MSQIKNVNKLEQILNGNDHTIDEMKVWLAPYEYDNVINKALGVSHPIPRGVLTMV
jgi:hypothetical protein